VPFTVSGIVRPGGHDDDGDDGDDESSGQDQ